MSVINSVHLRTADYTKFSARPEPAYSAVYSYVMEKGDAYARLDILSDSSGQFDVMGSVIPDEAAQIGVVTWIPIITIEGHAEQFERFVAQGPERVVATEPETLLWFSLRDRQQNNRYAIIDLYKNENGLLKHNNGKVASNLKENAPELVVGGWKSVVSNATVYTVTGQTT